ncbi:hypothetical protein [Nostoc sphaeroides]|uniref:Uncharacterized protein n=1 Tax=Nostoc sphaeroides CCNUC1 TaxID=2653204 RepID=A0A5P8W352_9NOSO|nr:hypothetical protein [Nostoc sphaeroides]QFS47157.1 hypothetical protein GXM_04647 [Nostoc sphaeroides CCNUC1]
MSLPVTVTFMLADWIVKGLTDGTLERVGGVIREVGSKRVISWLREVDSPPYKEIFSATQGILQVTSAVSILNLGVSVIGRLCCNSTTLKRIRATATTSTKSVK